MGLDEVVVHDNCNGLRRSSSSRYCSAAVEVEECISAHIVTLQTRLGLADIRILDLWEGKKTTVMNVGGRRQKLPCLT